MHHEDRDAHQTMCEAVDSQVDWHGDWRWHADQARKRDSFAGHEDYRSMRPKFMTEDMRTYFGNDPVDFDLEGMAFYPPTIQEMLDLKAKQAKQERAARLIEEAVIIATFLTVIVGLMFTPALWHWARALWGAVHG